MAFIPIVQPEVLEFLTELSFLSGYKAAVFDTKIRFEGFEAETRQRWERERSALERLIVFINQLILSLEAVELEVLHARLEERINERKSELGSDNPQFQAELYETERAIGIIGNIQKIRLAA